MNRILWNSLRPIFALAIIGGVALVMLPIRNHLSLAIPALVLVVPLVAVTALGGLLASIFGIFAAFFLYDLLFVPPYGSLVIGRAQGWVALAVYVCVVAVINILAISLRHARTKARRHESQTRQLYLLGDQLIGDQPIDLLVQRIVDTIGHAFSARWVAAFLPQTKRLGLSATSGEPPSSTQLETLIPRSGQLTSTRGTEPEGVTRLALSTSDRPVGLVVLSRSPLDEREWDLFRAYGHQAALAIERSQLRDEALRAKLLEQADQWREALLSAVSHDLRTPLASVKAAITTLRESSTAIGEDDRGELMALIESQSDALERLVANLLDMTRIRAGALQLKKEPSAVHSMLERAIAMLASGVPDGWISINLPIDLPFVNVDAVLIERVIANLVENAIRHSPDGGPIDIQAMLLEGTVELSVRDRGPGISVADETTIFAMFNSAKGGGRAGLGLAIAKTFLEVHDETLRYEDAPGGGARFVMTLPIAKDFAS